MEFNSDFRDMLVALNAAEVDYLVVGAYAVAAHGFPRESPYLRQLNDKPNGSFGSVRRPISSPIYMVSGAHRQRWQAFLLNRRLAAVE
jgi:hypothetical protein